MNTDNPSKSPADFNACHENCTDTDELADADARSSSSSFATDLVWMTFWSVLLGGLLTASHWFWVLSHWDDPTTAVPVGTVQRILFIGNLGIDFQIDTEEHSFMVRGVTEFRKAVASNNAKPWVPCSCATPMPALSTARTGWGTGDGVRSSP